MNRSAKMREIIYQLATKKTTRYRIAQNKGTSHTHEYTAHTL